VNLARKECGAAREDAKRALSLRDPDDLVPDLQVYYLLATVYAPRRDGARTDSKTEAVAKALRDRLV
jgi:hypothetical protein